jgi:hypothetical protein
VDLPGVTIPAAQIKVTPLDIGQLFGTRKVGNTVLLTTTRQTFNAIAPQVPMTVPDVGKATSTLTLDPSQFPSDQIVNDLNVTVTLTH